MSSTQQGAVHFPQGGNVLEVDGTAGGSIDTPASGGILPIGNTSAASVQIGPMNSLIGAASVPTTGSTLALPAHSSSMAVTPAGNITGVILPVGTVDGQELTVVNTSAFTVTFAAAGTSHVADGVSAVIGATKAMYFVWDAALSLWYHT